MTTARKRVAVCLRFFFSAVAPFFRFVLCSFFFFSSLRPTLGSQPVSVAVRCPLSAPCVFSPRSFSPLPFSSTSRSFIPPCHRTLFLSPLCHLWIVHSIGYSQAFLLRLLLSL